MAIDLLSYIIAAKRFGSFNFVFAILAIFTFLVWLSLQTCHLSVDDFVLCGGFCHLTLNVLELPGGRTKTTLL